MGELMSFNLNQIDEYMLALIVNAKALLKESEVLFEHKAFARSYTLSHIAREEIVMSKILYATALRIASGIDVDWKMTMKRLQDHQLKLKQEITENSILAALLEGQGDFIKMAGSMTVLPHQAHNMKSHSLYVDIAVDGEMSDPRKVISKRLAERNIELACHAIDEEASAQAKIRKLSTLKDRKRADSPAANNMSFEDKKALIKNVVSFLVKHSEQ
ncbi:AbiV family abortive infection protein [Marinomonas posidonica]|uniref:AbiV family abortive infection protein n=1 Tax=Marinomonas posidonica TaxID=936476 RepID=UPI0037352380